MLQEEIDETSQICFNNKKKSQICHRWDENTMSVVLSLKSSGFFLSKKKTVKRIRLSKGKSQVDSSIYRRGPMSISLLDSHY